MSSPEQTTLGRVVAMASVASIATLPAPEEDDPGDAERDAPGRGSDPAAPRQRVLVHQGLARGRHADGERLVEQERAEQAESRVVRDREEDARDVAGETHADGHEVGRVAGRVDDAGEVEREAEVDEALEDERDGEQQPMRRERLS